MKVVALPNIEGLATLTHIVRERGDMKPCTIITLETRVTEVVTPVRTSWIKRWADLIRWASLLHVVVAIMKMLTCQLSESMPSVVRECDA